MIPLLTPGQSAAPPRTVRVKLKTHMRFLSTAGPTYEPIDPVRFIGNRSSGQMGAALANAATSARHSVTLILGPVTAPMPDNVRRIDVFSSRSSR